ncbi:MAG: hypothetical protein JSV71_03870, partial [Nitrospiraceae bacterium]
CRLVSKKVRNERIHAEFSEKSRRYCRENKGRRIYSDFSSGGNVQVLLPQSVMQRSEIMKIQIS